MLIKNVKIYTMADEIIENGDILIKGGKIEKVGENIKAEDEQIIDGEGLIAVPGFIDAHSHMGGFDFSRLKAEDDVNEMTNNITPEVEAIYGTNVESKEFAYSYQNGITTAIITPGSGNVICGQVFATKTYGHNLFDMTIKNPVAMKVALGMNPKGSYGRKQKSPMTRMAIAQIIKDLLRDTKEYYLKKESAAKNGEKMPDFDEKLEAVIPVIKKEIPLKIHCTQYDMLTAIDIAKEFDVRFSLDHAWGATKYIDEIVESGCDVVFGPVGVTRWPGECYPIDIESVVELDKRGVTVGLGTDAPIVAVNTLIHHAGEAVREGCEVERALRMITINSAKILGIDDRVGSIEEGKDADIVLFKGLPAYNTNAKVIYTIIDGEVVYEA